MTSSVIYKINHPLTVKDIIAVFASSNISRPVEDFNRIETMFKHSNLVVSAWDGEELVGLARSLTDFSYCCYLSDLAVKRNYQNNGIGKSMLALTKEEIGDKVMLLLVAAPNALEYYPKANFENIQNAFVIKRKQ